MNHIKIAASLDDTGELRKTMLDNPELPIMIFVGEESYSGEYPYSLAEISSTGIRELGIWEEYYIDKDDLRDMLFDKYSGDYETEEELGKYVSECMDNTEFIKAIVIVLANGG